MKRSLRAFLATPFVALGMAGVVASLMLCGVGAVISGKSRRFDDLIEAFLDALRVVEKRGAADQER